MFKPYGVMADVHAHAWSAFSRSDGEGRNNRLMEIIAEVRRCAKAVQEAGGNRIVIAGDIFHVRGAVTPSVFNPVKDALDSMVADGLEFVGMPGNHDLEGNDSSRLGSSFAMLEGPGIDITHCTEISHEHRVVMVPWMKRHADLLTELGECRDQIKGGMYPLGEYDLFIHAGIDGVLPGIPPHGLRPEKLASFGFKRVFAGDYHNHKDMGGGVWSIGAPVHHKWSDIGAKAGWLVVSEHEVKFHSSHAPRFVEVTPELSPEDIVEAADGNYVRLKLGEASIAETQAWREELTRFGARGVLIQAMPPSTSVRTGKATASLDRLEESVEGYCTDNGYGEEIAKAARALIEEVSR